MHPSAPGSANPWGAKPASGPGQDRPLPPSGQTSPGANQVSLIPVLSDNYVFVLHGDSQGSSQGGSQGGGQGGRGRSPSQGSSGEGAGGQAKGAAGPAVVVDPAVAEPVIAWLEERHLEPVAVLQTHHHHDHIGGTPELLRRWPQLQVIAAAADRQRIPFQTQGVGDGDQLQLLGRPIQVLAMPGHTRAHVAFYLPPAEGVLGHPSPGELFCGDTLFAGGCGRLMEGSAEQLWQSLQRLAALPAATRVWCSHEYTEANLRWAHHLHPDDPAIKERFEAVLQARAAERPTIPSSIGEELQTNLFVRSHDAEEFARYRHSKDHWRG